MRYLLIILLLFLFFALTLKSSFFESPIDDEPTYIANGLQYIKYGNLSFNSGSPILANIIVSSPLLLISNSLQIPNDEKYFQSGWGHGYARDLLMFNRDKIDLILFLVRMPVILAGLLLGLLLFIWIKHWYGYLAGILGLSLYVTEPNIIAHSHYATLDIFLALFIVGTLFFLYLSIIKNEKKYFILFITSFVFAQLTKVTALFLFPFCFFIFYFYSNKVNFFGKFKEAFLRILILAFISFMAINTFYGWRDIGLPLERYLKQDNSVINSEYPISLIESKLPFNGKPLGKISEYFYKEFPLPITYQYMKVFGWTFFRTSYPQPLFLAGHYFSSGWIANFPLTTILKMPITLLFLFCTSIILFFVKKRKLTKEEFAFIIVPLVIFVFTFISSSRLYTAYRLMIFLVPLIIIFTSSWVKNLSKYSSIFFIVALLQFYIALSNFPNFLGFANFIDQKDKYKYLSDANLDWGQDVKQLSQYIKENKIKSIKQNLYGIMNTGLYNVPYNRFGPPWVKEDGGPIEDCEPKGPGLYAISASQLTGTSLKNHNCFSWLIKKGTLIKVIGSSIYIFKIR